MTKLPWIILLLIQVSFQQIYTATLALSWLSGFCQTEVQQHRQACLPSLVALWDNQSHTIHGLWSDKKAASSYGAFNINLFEKNLKLLDDMHNYWPAKVKVSSSNVFLWQHEWTKHGQDYAEIIYRLRPEDFPGTVEERNAALQLAYFRDTVNLYKSLKAKKLPGKSYTKSNFASQLGVSQKQLILYCFENNYIREVRVCYQITKSGLTPIDCTKATTTCTNGGATIQFVNWAMKGQERVFDYAKLHQRWRVFANLISE